MKNLEERARWLRHHCKETNHMEIMTPRGKLELRIYDCNGQAIRVSSKDDKVVDISKTHPAMLRPFNPKWQDFQFGGF